MKWRITIRPAARTDLQEARGWYDQKRPGLGDEFFLEISNSLSCLEESPGRFPLYWRDFRRVLIDRFPYKVFYRVDRDDVIVYRILHAARDHRWLLR